MLAFTVMIVASWVIMAGLVAVAIRDARRARRAADKARHPSSMMRRDFELVEDFALWSDEMSHDAP